MNALELKIPPVVVVLLAVLGMWLVAAMDFLLRVELPGRIALAGLLAIAGVSVAGAGVVEFRRAGTTLNPMKPDAASSLVDGGVYRVTRNPMYLGFLLALLGWAVFLGSAAALLVVALFVLYMNRFQIAPEERALAARFGKQFDAYRTRVRRWL